MGFLILFIICILLAILVIAIVLALCFAEGKVLKEASIRKRNYKIGVVIGVILCICAFAYSSSYSGNLGTSLMEGIDVKTAKADNLYLGKDESYRKKILEINEVFCRYKKDGRMITPTKELEEEMKDSDFDSKSIQYDFSKKNMRNYDDSCITLLDHPQNFNYKVKEHRIYVYCKEHKELVSTYLYRAEDMDLIKDLEKAGLTGLRNWIKQTTKEEGIQVKTQDGKTVEVLDGTYDTQLGKEQIAVSFDNDSICINVDSNHLNRYQVLSKIQSKLQKDGWNDIDLQQKGYLKMISSSYVENLKVGKEGEVDIVEATRLFVKDKKVSKMVISFDQYNSKNKSLISDAFLIRTASLGQYMSIPKEELKNLLTSLCKEPKNTSGKIGSVKYQFNTSSSYDTEINGVKVKDSNCHLILYK